MTGFCDIHCHMLYGVDDGSHSINQSLRMLDIAYSEGIRTVILTPHYNRRFGVIEKDELQKRYDTLCSEAAERYPDMQFYLGNEVYYSDETLEKLQTGEAHTMAGGRYVLLEFATYVETARLYHAVSELVQYGYIPILAHVERYDCLLNHPEDVAELTEMGAYIQVNADSVMGDNGRSTRKFVRNLLREQQVHFIATDSHKDTHRAPYMQKCANYVEKKYGHDYAERIFAENPQCIIKNEYI